MFRSTWYDNFKETDASIRGGGSGAEQKSSEHRIKPPVPVEFEVEDIVAHRIVSSELEFFVKWKNYSYAECTWEPERNLVNCIEILERYLRQCPQLRKIDRLVKDPPVLEKFRQVVSSIPRPLTIQCDGPAWQMYDRVSKKRKMPNDKKTGGKALNMAYDPEKLITRRKRREYHEQAGWEYQDQENSDFKRKYQPAQRRSYGHVSGSATAETASAKDISSRVAGTNSSGGATENLIAYGAGDVTTLTLMTGERFCGVFVSDDLDEEYMVPIDVVLVAESLSTHTEIVVEVVPVSVEQ